MSRTGRYKVFPIVGSVLVVVGMALLSQLGLHTSHLTMSIYVFVLGAGMGMTMQLMVLATQNAVAPTQIGTATGTSTASQIPIQNQVPGTGVVQPIGTVRAYAMSGGKIGLILDGTTTLSELDISPYPFHQRKGYAHSFAQPRLSFVPARLTR